MITIRINKHVGPWMKIPQCKGDNGSPSLSEDSRSLASIENRDPLSAVSPVPADAPWAVPSPPLADFCTEGGQSSQSKATFSEVNRAFLGAMASKWAVIKGWMGSGLVARSAHNEQSGWTKQRQHLGKQRRMGAAKRRDDFNHHGVGWLWVIPGKAKGPGGSRKPETFSVKVVLLLSTPSSVHPPGPVQAELGRINQYLIKCKFHCPHVIQLWWLFPPTLPTRCGPQG